MRAYRPEGTVDAEKIGYSHAVERDGRLYVSGQVGWNEEFEIADSFEEQVRTALENLERVLDASGRTPEDVAKVTAHIVDPEERADAFLDEWRRWAPEDPYPCLTILGVSGLAREEFLVELEAEVVPADSDD